ncbi:hypothetical protein NDU88_005015 [Pleurodeles waltl]|uniref:Uncharacterized protein n=1 Tax=Pleurodeles waltl TaxID=8319 RepID=A0AAV7WAN7_PLEWA|nr:hypothetical protein NDU88_005015 [Pleurodeles waltl]
MIIRTDYEDFSQLLNTANQDNIAASWWKGSSFVSSNIEGTDPRRKLSKSQKREQKETVSTTTPISDIPKAIMSIAGQLQQAQREDPTLKIAWQLALAPDTSPTDTASTPQYPSGTFASGLPDPEALPPSSYQKQPPGDGGIHKSLNSTSWRERRKHQEDPLRKRPEEDHEEHPERLDEPSESETQHSRLCKRHTSAAVYSPSLGPEAQEAATPKIRPRSGESVALAGTVQ